MADLTLSEIMSRASAAFSLGFSHKGKRNLYDTFGYDRQLTVEQLDSMYKRNDIANRIISAFPQATWREPPQLSDDSGDTTETSNFVKDAHEFFKSKRIYHYMERLDRLSGIGQYAILFMGFDDQFNSDEPLPDGNHDLLYVQPYSEISAKITKFVEDENDERFGLPELYTITPRAATGSVSNRPAKAIKVHHSRVIHVSEFLDEDDVYGIPKLMPVYNRLKDLEKVVGGSSEMFWQNGRGGIMMSADKEAKFTDADKALMRSQAEEYENEIRRMMIGKGMTLTPITLEVPDPKPNVDVILDLISGTVLIPKRILTGSERGELASSQDENNFATRNQERRVNYAIPVIMDPFIQKMIDTGNIIAPNGMFEAFWLDDDGLNETQKVDIAVKKTQALVSYSNSSADIVMPVGEFRHKILELEPEIDYDTYDIELREDEDLGDEEEDDFEEETDGQETEDEQGSDKDSAEDEDEDDEEPFANFKRLEFMKAS